MRNAVEIIQKIKEMDCGYMLKEQRINNGSIGFVVYKREGASWMESPFFHIYPGGINNRINHYGYTLNFLYINETMPRTDRNTRLNQADIKASSSLRWKCIMTTSSCSRNPRFHLPSLDNSFQENDVDAVSINNVQGTNKAVSYLCGMGHRGDWIYPQQGQDQQL